ncbi:MAG: tetratricopeptide repeat protein [Pseudomonadota bacterium]
MTRFTAPLIAVLLCGSALAGCASDGGGALGGIFSAKKTETAKADAAKADAAANAEPALTMDIETGVRQAQAQRSAQRYDDAIHTLSQLMLVASDDPRVVGEYGKTLTEKGRAQDAVQFLTRATQLQPGDWSLYSALGVAYDQVGDQSSARMAYEHALKLKPNEPSVLNNYALSRMLANDPETARQLIARAQTAGGVSDPKIARNIELMDKLAPAAQLAAAPVPAPVQKAAMAEPPAPVSAPAVVNTSPLPPAAPSAQNAAAHPAPAPKIVMQAVPVDPLAGPAKSATRAPTPLATHVVAEKAAVPRLDTKTVVKPEIAKLEPAKTEAVKAITAKVETGKPATVKPEFKAEAKPAKAEVKPDAKTPAKPGSKAIPALRQTASAY